DLKMEKRIAKSNLEIACSEVNNACPVGSIGAIAATRVPASVATTDEDLKTSVHDDFDYHVRYYAYSKST
ncbi:hypothetical protein Tco_0065088, partial [Tanacetum coccineum]